MRLILTVVAATTVFIAGCTTGKSDESNDSLSKDNPAIEYAKYAEFSGRAYLNETAICVALETNNCLGRFETYFDDYFPVYRDTEHGFVTARWNSTATEIQSLDMFIFSGEYPGDYQIVARGHGESPLTLSFTGEDLVNHFEDHALAGNSTRLGVGFSADGPVKITDEQYIYWNVVVLSDTS